jgi:hypothetical protein
MNRHGHTLEPILGLLASLMASVVAITQARFDPDIVAVLGAILAAVIAVIEAREKNRTLTHTISVFIASSGVGSVLPGSIVWTFWPEKVTTLSWHVWAIAGGVSGLLGWSLTAAVLALRSRVPGLVNRTADRLLPPESNNRNNTDPES